MSAMPPSRERPRLHSTIVSFRDAYIVSKIKGVKNDPQMCGSMVCSFLGCFWVGNQASSMEPKFGSIESAKFDFTEFKFGSIEPKIGPMEPNVGSIEHQNLVL